MNPLLLFFLILRLTFALYLPCPPSEEEPAQPLSCSLSNTELSHRCPRR